MSFKNFKPKWDKNRPKWDKFSKEIKEAETKEEKVNESTHDDGVVVEPAVSGNS